MLETLQSLVKSGFMGEKNGVTKILQFKNETETKTSERCNCDGKSCNRGRDAGFGCRAAKRQASPCVCLPHYI